MQHVGFVAPDPQRYATHALSSPHDTFGQAQSALAGAGSTMKLVKYACVGFGALFILGGAATLLAFDAMTGVMFGITSGVLIGVGVS